jgi:hypothetical protein
VIYNRNTGNLVGGHQRTNYFLQGKAEIEIDKEYVMATSTGTMAEGYIVLDGERYAYREVYWTPEQEERANILANKAGGEWDMEILANQFDVDTLLESGFDAEELGFGFDSDDKEEKEEKEKSGSKNLVLSFETKEEAEEASKHLDRIMADFATDNQAEALVHLMSYYDDIE